MSGIDALVDAVASVDDRVDVTDVLYANARLFADLVELIEGKKIGQEEFDAGIDSANESLEFFANMFQTMLDVRNATKEA